MAQQIQDEGFHEIQLNGKQLVFLFMAATVVSVVIFLCGVLVGRGVKAQLGAAADSTPLASAAETTPTQAPTPAPVPAAGSDPTKVAPPPPPGEELTYFQRLEGEKSAKEQLKPAPHTPPPPVPSPAKEPARAAVPAVASAATTTQEPAGQGFAVQIAALNVRSEADAIAKRLSSKGYAAYVLMPVNGTPSVFRVRVGKFNTRHEAETVATRLQKEEQFKPWVTR